MPRRHQQSRRAASRRPRADLRREPTIRTAADVDTPHRLADAVTPPRTGFELPRPTAAPQIVKIGGVTGLFTPITNKPDTPITDDERGNLQALIDDQTKQIADLQSQNAELRKQIDDLKNPPQPPDAFTSAVQQTLDELQQKLTTMKNPTSNFALKDFRLEAKVMVDVSKLGTIQYRFIRPGDRIDANAISNITLDLVPLPKGGADRTWTPDLFQPDVGVEGLPELTAEQANTLRTNQIFSIADFLQVGTRARTAVELASLLKVERETLSGWLNQAELLTLKGTNGATVLVLTAAGFPTLNSVAGAKPETLRDAYLAARKRLRNTDAVEATLDAVTQWIAGARRYVGLKKTAE